MSKSYDLIVIGAGPGGYVAAIRGAQLGKMLQSLKNNAGGTCLNVGCIPSKTLLEHGEKTQHTSCKRLGNHNERLKIDFTQFVQRKESCTNTYGWREAVVKENKVTYIEGEARISKNLKVDVNNETYQAKDIILATGSQPFIPPIDGLDQVNYETTDTFFDLEKLPKQLAVIGGV